jgi:hypothetical protein
MPRTDQATAAPPADPTADPLDALLGRAEQADVDDDIRGWLAALRRGDQGTVKSEPPGPRTQADR